MILKCTDNELGKKISSATLKIIKGNPKPDVFSYLIMSIPIIIEEQKNDSDKIPGYCGVYSTEKAIYFDVRKKEKILENIKLLDGAELLIKHEIMHIILSHIKRGNIFMNKKKVKTNAYFIAADYIINREIGLTNETFITFDFLSNIPGLTIREVVDKMSTEEIAEKLMGSVPPSSMFIDDKGCDSEDGEEVNKETKNNSSGYKNYNDYFKDTLQKAIMKGHDAGKEQSEFWKNLENGLFESKHDYKKILYNHLNNSFKKAETGHKIVNRRYYQLEAQIKDTMITFEHRNKILQNILIAVDTSGSIDDKTYIKEIGEIVNLVKNIGIEGTICLFDTSIKRKIKVDLNTKIKELKKELLKRSDGGTNFNCINDLEEELKPKLTIILSDLMASYPSKFHYETIFITYVKTDYNKIAEKHGKVYIMQ